MEHKLKSIAALIKDNKIYSLSNSEGFKQQQRDETKGWVFVDKHQVIKASWQWVQPCWSISSSPKEFIEIFNEWDIYEVYKLLTWQMCFNYKGSSPSGDKY